MTLELLFTDASYNTLLWEVIDRLSLTTRQALGSCTKHFYDEGVFRKRLQLRDLRYLHFWFHCTTSDLDFHLRQGLPMFRSDKTNAVDSERWFNTMIQPVSSTWVLSFSHLVDALSVMATPILAL
jgi:hypothetical protein